MRLKARVKQLAIIPSKECLAINFYDSTLLDVIEKFVGKDVTLTLETGKKSRDAERYMWALRRQISEHPDVELSDIEVYQEAIVSAGCNNWFDGAVRQEEFKAFCDTFTYGHVGWFVAHYADTKDGLVQYRAYYGSSMFTREQMSRLVDYVVREAEEYKIPTLESEEIERLIKSWRAG